MLKAGHTYGNTLPGAAAFYPLLPKVGRDTIEWEVSGGVIPCIIDHKINNTYLLCYLTLCR